MRKHRTHRHLLRTLGLLAVVFVACGEPAVPDTPGGAEGPGAEPAIEWENPRTQQLFSSIEDAAGELSFSPVMPRFGRPEKIFVTPPQTTARDDRVLTLLFRDESSAPFHVVEERASPTWKDNYDGAVAQCQPSNGCNEEWSVVTVREGVRALLIEDEEVTSITWKEGDIEFLVIGPASTFTAPEALATANSL